MTRTGIRKWTPIEKLLIDTSKVCLDSDKNPQVLHCLFCDKVFRFEDQALNHLWAKHRKQFVEEVIDLRRELKEAKAAIAVYRGLSQEG